MRKNCTKYIFFRDDDIYRHDKKLEKLIDIFVNSRTPLTLSVIPKKLEKNCCSLLSNIIKSNKNLIDIVQHGFCHLNHSVEKKKKYEFGLSRSYQEQENDIRKGRKTLKEKLAIKAGIFVPPWNGYDDNTLKILIKERFSIISTDIKHCLLNSTGNLKNIFTNIYLNKKTATGAWFTDNPDTLFSQIISNGCSTIGIEMHHKYFKDEEDFKSLSCLISKLKTKKNVKFIRLCEAKKYSSYNKDIRLEPLIYYLTYQFVPKPLSLLNSRSNPIHKKYDFAYFKKIKLLRENETEIKRKLYIYLSKAIENSLPKDKRPVALLLSCGIDSMAILHLLREITERRIYTITGFYIKNPENTSLLRKLSKKYGTIHRTITVQPNALRLLDKIYSHKIPQPIGDNGLLTNYILYNDIKKYANAIFSGDGADCLFSGLKMHLINLVNRNNKNINKNFEHYKFGEIFLNRKELKLFFDQTSHDLDLTTPLKSFVRRIETKDALKRQVIIDLNYLVKHRIDYLIYAAQICKVNFLLPYLEKNFVNFAVKIPGKYLINDFQQKYILRETFRDKLPPEVIDRKKEVSSPPFRLWYEENKEFVMGKLIKSMRVGIPRNYVKYLISAIPRSSNYRIGMKIWLILNLVCWYEGTNNSFQEKFNL